jgi:hypothetical protein
LAGLNTNPKEPNVTTRKTNQTVSIQEKINDTSYPTPSQLPKGENHITVATKGALALTGRSEEPKRIWKYQIKLLGKPPVVQVLKNFQTFYGSQRFITVFARALH